jgi:hypothetical protein
MCAPCETPITLRLRVMICNLSAIWVIPRTMVNTWSAVPVYSRIVSANNMASQ